MYRILIADDEPLEREGMELIINSMLSQKVEIIHAENGREAIQKTLIQKPHIVLMDIRMPGIDGLNALKAIKADLPNIKMVLVTAFDYFEYAKEAIHLGVKDYLVKPAKRKDIISLLEKLLHELDEEAQERHLQELNRNRLTTFTQLAKMELALGLMSEQMSDETLTTLADLVQFPLEHCCAIVLALPNQHEDIKSVESFIFASLYRVMEQFRDYHYIASTIINEHMAIFVRSKLHTYESILIDAKKIGHHLLHLLSNEMSIEAYIGIGSVKDDMTGIKRSYFEAIFASTNVSKEEPLYIFENIQQRLTQPLQMATTADALYVQKAIEKIRHEREHETFTMIDHVTDYIHKNYNRELTLEGAAEYVHLNPYYLSKVFKQQTGETFIDYLTNVRISHAKKWMEQKDLSLKEICYLVGYNDPNYLSRVFKKVVGQTPSEYRQTLP